mgnify:CR=1 FL=1
MQGIEQLRAWLEGYGLGDFIAQNTLVVFAIVVSTAFTSFLAKRLQLKLEHNFAKTENLWDDAFLYAMRKPTTYIIWVIGLSLAAHSIGLDQDPSIGVLFEALRKVGIIVCLAWFVIRFIKQAEKLFLDPRRVKNSRNGEGADETTVHAVGKLLRASVIVTAVLVILQTLGFSISGVLAFGGIGGIAVGFAAKDLLANFFGGLMIYLDRPFKVGDWVRSPDQEIEGTVEKIGWRLTTIRTFDKRPLYVPNQVFTNVSVQNPSRMSHRRIYETVGLRYDDSNQLEQIISNVKSMLMTHAEIDNTQTMIVNFNAFGSSSLDFFIYTFTKTTNWIKYHEVKQDVLLQIMRIVADAKAEIAFPTSTVLVSEVPELKAIGLNTVMESSVPNGLRD